MKVLLDECLPRKLKDELPGHAVSTVPQMGCAGKQNGELLRLAADEFDVFVTSDQHLQYQQNLRAVRLAVMVLVANDNRLESLRRFMPDEREALLNVEQGSIVRVGS